MAQKPVKKTPTKKSASVKRATARRAAPVVDDVIIISEHDDHHEHAGCGCHAGHHCGCMNGNPCKCGGGFWRFIKRLFWFLVIFALGFATCMLLCSHGPRHHRGPKMPIEFVNGCLDVNKIECPEFRAKLMKADTNNDGCVSREEYRTVKQAMRDVRGMRRGDKPAQR